MSYCNTNILITNIKKLMKDNSITQEKLAEILGMSQSNVSKALNENDKKSFTFDQVVGIAKHFRVSIDKLVSNNRVPTSENSPRAIAAILAKMIEEGDAEYFTIQKSKNVFEVEYDGYEPGCTVETRNIEYPAIYMRSYWDAPEKTTTEEKAELLSEATQIGNDTRMLPVNTFLKQFKEIHDIHKNKGLSDETYATVVADLLSHLRDY